MFSPTQTEQRQHPRKVVNITVHLSCHNNAFTSCSASVRDLSLKGMALQVRGLALAIGDKVCICLSDANAHCGAEHLIEASVVNLRDDFAGLQFESVGIFVLKDIQQLLREERSF